MQMLPSMPILFARESQDAFGNKIQPSSSVQGENNATIDTAKQKNPLRLQKEIEDKSTTKSKEQSKAPTNSNENQKEMVLVTSYFLKVKSRFAANSNQPTNKFVQFQNLLKAFDPLKETPVDLYKKIEMLFGEEHKDLTEDFLLFLTSSQAEEVGRFMDHYEMNKMTNFIDILKSTFAHHPTILRKVIRAINNSLNCGDLEEMKSRVLPHFRSHPRLIHLFKSLFPEERPPDSWYDATDTISETILTNDQGYDIWEIEEPKKVKEVKYVKGEVDTVYVQGRVFLRHGKMIRAARVTFPYSKEPYRVHGRRLAPAHCPPAPSPPDSDEERASLRRNVANKNTKKITKRPKKSQSKTSCTKQDLKDVNDNNKQTIESNKVTSAPETNKRTNKSTTQVQSDKQMNKQATPDNRSDMKDLKHNKLTAKDKTDSIKHTDRNHTHKREKQKEKQKHTAEQKKEPTKAKQPKLESVEQTHTMEKQNKPETVNWTRDEDKTMLQILKGEAGSEQIFCKIRELLPHRSLTDIRERFLHVITLLQQMAVGEVT